MKVVHDIIRALDCQAVDNPQKIAYSDENTLTTYHTLKTLSDLIATNLQQQITDQGPLVVWGGQDVSMVATFLGAVKAGHAYIPVDDHSPQERIKQIVAVAKPQAILALTELKGDYDVPVLNYDQLTAPTVAELDLTKRVQNDDTFYIIFTSGTTGMPKGVQISHNNLCSYVNWMLSDFNLSEGIQALSQPPYSFDLSVMDLYPTLLLGGTLHVLRKEVTDNFKLLFSRLGDLRVNEWVSTPSFVEMALLDPSFDEHHHPELTHFLFCGEELTHSTAATLLKRFPQAQVFNTYGPTEATVAISQVQITPAILAAYDRLPIGYVKADTTISFLNTDEETGLGELVITGPSVSKGYLNNPERTALAFSKKEGVQSYRTGDLAYCDQHGLLFYRGRTDFQVKLHGFRIELEEVDHHLTDLSYVKQAATAPRYDRQHKVTQLVAFVTLEQGIDLPPTSQQIKADLGATMMPYMVPQRIEIKHVLPSTPNGKIDRKALIAEVNAC